MEDYIKKVEVLDKGYVGLLSVLGNEMMIAQYARVSKNKKRVSRTEEQDLKLVEYLYKHHHTSPFEFPKMTFEIHTPILVARQWLRHRMANVNESSGRHSEYEDEFYCPSLWRKASTSNKQGSGEPYEDLLEQERLRQHQETSYRLYEDALRRGIAKEEARLYLPAFGLYTTFVFCQDAHNLMGFFRQRLGKEAQWEIRQYAEVMFDMFKDYFPTCARLMESSVW